MFLNLLKNIALPLIFIFAISCGSSSNSLGGVEAGNPSLRTLTGDTTSSSTASVNALIQKTNNLYVTENGCLTDDIIAIDSQGNQTETQVDENCQFEMQLTPQKAYRLLLRLTGTEPTPIRFNNGPNQLESFVFLLGPGSGILNLGRISLTNGILFPEREPAEFEDFDGDGHFDYDDDDDDDNGIGDDFEEDCDLDGFFNPFDDDSECDDDNNNDDNEDDSGDNNQPQIAKVLEVRPPNGATNIPTDERIRIRFGCQISETSFLNSVFTLTSGGTDVNCELNLESDNTRIECEPDPGFISNATHNVSLSGLECDSGNTIPNITWSFSTSDDEESEDD